MPRSPSAQKPFFRYCKSYPQCFAKKFNSVSPFRKTKSNPNYPYYDRFSLKTHSAASLIGVASFPFSDDKANRGCLDFK